MADGSVNVATTLKGKVSAEEWQRRVDLAALYRLVAMHGWDDLIYTHISARIPGPEHHFLLNPHGLLFEEITASSLVKVDLDAKILQETPYSINPAGFTPHSAIHAGREDAQFVMHLHTDYGAAVASQKEGLLPLTIQALTVLPRLAYHDFEGITLNHGERERMVANLGDKAVMFLRNHGTLAVGKTAAACWLGMYTLEQACKKQVLALSAGRENVLFAPDASVNMVRSQTASGNTSVLSSPAWPACLRKLERDQPGYDV